MVLNGFDFVPVPVKSLPNCKSTYISGWFAGSFQTKNEVAVNLLPLKFRLGSVLGSG